MTGLYQCYCRTTTLFSPLTHTLDNKCISYTYLDFGGGIYVTIPFGILIGILNNVGAWLIIKNIKDIGFHSNQSQRQATFVSIFVLSYFNSGLFITWLPEIVLENTQFTVATNLSSAWIQIYGIMIFTTTITTNLTPYIGVLIDMMSRRFY